MSMMTLVGRGADHHSVTFAHLGKLPRIPIPTLEETLQRFEEWCAPLLTATELAETRRTIAAFGQSGGAGEKLHRALCQYDQQAGVYSWLDEFWPARYLGRRVPVAINANFVFLFRDKPKGQLERAAELVAAMTTFKQALDAETLPAASLRGRPLCMAQYKYLFSATRIPGKVRDTVNVPYSETRPGPAKARHIIVLHRGHLFTLEVISVNGQAYTLAEIEQALERIMHLSPQPVADQAAIGYLTTLARADWADVRAELLNKAPQNAETLTLIEEALFCLCLDDDEPTDRLQATDVLLQGNGANRWFDKSVSLIVFKNGKAGVNCEHCGLDGTVVVELIDALHDDAVLQQLAVANQKTVGTPSSTEISCVLDDSLQRHIIRARDDFKALADQTATHYFRFKDFGTRQIKALNISPDAFLQLAFQLAHFRTKGLIGATYESIATRHFERGRTEAMRVVSAESCRFVELMESTADVATKQAALRQAADKHISRAKACQAGQAPEQHLWQLLLLAEENRQALAISADDLAIFQSPGWLIMRDDYLSTSSAPSDNVTIFGFGATSEKCIGVAYLPRTEAIYAYLSTPTPVAAQMHRFAEHLAQALRDLNTLLQEDV